MAAFAALAIIGGHARADVDQGGSLDGQPGLVRVATAEPMARALSLALASGYGFRGETLATGDSHHRLAGRLAAAWRAQPWLSVGLRLDGRYDRHLDTPSGTDDGWVGDPRLTARAVRRAGSGLALGGELGLWFPADAPLSVDGLSVEGRGIASYALAGGFAVAANIGARLDRSAETVDDPDRLSLADRMALGVSDANAVLIGAGVRWRRGDLVLVGDWSWDLLVGSGAPSAAESPMRVAGAARVRVGPELWLHGGVEVGLSATPEVAMGSPLVPLEPRLAVTLGVSYQLPETRGSAGGGEIVVPDPKPEPEPALGTLRGRVVDDSGGPLVGARVRVGDRETVTDQDGRFELAELPVGPVTLEITADGHQRRTVDAVVGGAGADGPAAVDVALERTLPPGQIRGLVRSLAGKPIGGARVVVQPLGTSLRSEADGSFRVDVPPGTYTVEVSARGYARQRRSLTVDQNGVTVINLELRGGGGR